MSCQPQLAAIRANAKVQLGRPKSITDEQISHAIALLAQFSRKPAPKPSPNSSASPAPPSTRMCCWPRALAAARPSRVSSMISSRMIMWTGGCRQGDVAVSRAVLKWRSRRHADQLEAAAETDRRLDWERRSAAVQAAARERDRQLLGQEHAVEILGSTPLPPRSDWHQLRVHELLVSDPTDVLH